MTYSGMILSLSILASALILRPVQDLLGAVHYLRRVARGDL